MYLRLGSNRLQKRRVALTELGIDVCCFWPESQMDLSKNKLKPNKLINWLISQQMLLGIIILRLMNMCCATKQFSATKISNRKIKFYLLSDGFVYQKSPRWIFFGGCSWRSMIPLRMRKDKSDKSLFMILVAPHNKL